MQTDDTASLAFIEVAMHCIPHLSPQGTEIIRLGEDVCIYSPGDEASLGGFLDDEVDFCHGKVLL